MLVLHPAAALACVSCSCALLPKASPAFLSRGARRRRGASSMRVLPMKSLVMQGEARLDPAQTLPAFAGQGLELVSSSEFLYIGRAPEGRPRYHPRLPLNRSLAGLIRNVHRSCASQRNCHRSRKRPLRHRLPLGPGIHRAWRVDLLRWLLPHRDRSDAGSGRRAIQARRVERNAQQDDARQLAGRPRDQSRTLAQGGRRTWAAISSPAMSTALPPSSA